MTSRSDPSGGRVVPPVLDESDWIVGGLPVVADGVEPPAQLALDDRFACTRCSEPLAVVVHLGDAAPAGDVEVLATCGRCGSEQRARLQLREWQPQRFVLVAVGTTEVRRGGRRWTTWLAIAALAAVLGGFVAANVAVATAAWRSHVVLRDGERAVAVVAGSGRSDGGWTTVESYWVRLLLPGASQPAEVEVDGRTFSRVTSREEVAVRVEGDLVEVPGNRAQRDDLVAMALVDAVVALALVLVVGLARATARDAAVDPRA